MNFIRFCPKSNKILSLFQFFNHSGDNFKALLKFREQSKFVFGMISLHSSKPTNLNIVPSFLQVCDQWKRPSDRKFSVFLMDLKSCFFQSSITLRVHITSKRLIWIFQPFQFHLSLEIFFRKMKLGISRILDSSYINFCHSFFKKLLHFVEIECRGKPNVTFYSTLQNKI
jgi:hypothetical protein